MKISTLLATACAAVLGLSVTATSIAASKADIDKGVVTTISDFNKLHASNTKLNTQAAGVLVFPTVTKAGAGVGGEFGEGVLQVDGKTVGYYNLASGSVGATLGAAQHSQIIMFMTKESLDKFTKSGGWSIGANADITVVSSSAGTDYDSMTANKPVLGFAFAEKGLIGDLSLGGSKITKIEK